MAQVPVLVGSDGLLAAGTDGLTTLDEASEVATSTSVLWTVELALPTVAQSEASLPFCRERRRFG